MSNVGDGISAERGNWKFSGEATKSFDEHVSKSVPLYCRGSIEIPKNRGSFIIG